MRRFFPGMLGTSTLAILALVHCGGEAPDGAAPSTPTSDAADADAGQEASRAPDSGATDGVAPPPLGRLCFTRFLLHDDFGSPTLSYGAAGLYATGVRKADGHRLLARLGDDGAPLFNLDIEGEAPGRPDRNGHLTGGNAATIYASGPEAGVEAEGRVVRRDGMDGRLVWSRRFWTASGIYGFESTTSRDGSALVMASYRSYVRFEESALGIPNSDSSGIFVAKLDATDGHPLWVTAATTQTGVGSITELESDEVAIAVHKVLSGQPAGTNLVYLAGATGAKIGGNQLPDSRDVAAILVGAQRLVVTTADPEFDRGSIVAVDRTRDTPAWSLDLPKLIRGTVRFFPDGPSGFAYRWRSTQEPTERLTRRMASDGAIASSEDFPAAIEIQATDGHGKFFFVANGDEDTRLTVGTDTIQFPQQKGNQILLGCIQR